MIKKLQLVLLFFISFTSEVFLQDISHLKIHFTSKEINRVSIDSFYSYSFAAIDSSGEMLSYSTINLPAWLSYNSVSQTVSGKPSKAGQYFIDLVAASSDTAVHQRFMLTVYNNETLNILALGNSITNGTNKFNSYRRSLWQLLHNNNYNFDFIGSWNSHHMGGNVPDPDFDMDHEGHSGWTAHDLINPPVWDNQRGNLNQWLRIYTPNIVLLEMGTNEVFHCTKTSNAIKDISSVIDILKAKNKNVKIFIALIPPLGLQWADKKLCGNNNTYQKSLTNFNNALRLFVNAKNDKQLKLVDQYTGIDPSKNMYDDIHPNDAGEKIMVKRWYGAIHNYLKKLKN